MNKKTFKLNQSVLVTGLVKAFPLKVFCGTIAASCSEMDNTALVKVAGNVHMVKKEAVSEDSKTPTKALEKVTGLKKAADRTTYPVFSYGQSVFVKFGTVGRILGRVTCHSTYLNDSVSVQTGSEIKSYKKTEIESFDKKEKEGAKGKKHTPQIRTARQRATYAFNQTVLVTNRFTKRVEEGVVCKYATYNDDTVLVKVGCVTSTHNKENVDVKPYVPKITPKFADHKKKTDDEKYFADLVCAKSHMDVVNLALEGVDMDKFTPVQHKDWYALMPEDVDADDKLPCLIAHTDLHPSLTHPTLDNLEYEDGKFSGPDGLGADDRAGIFTINKLLRRYPGKFMVLFPDKEEVGLIGSTAFTRSKAFNVFDKYASVFISIDRRRGHNGKKSIATYGSDCKKLNSWVEALTGRDSVRGSSTDCKALSSASKNKVPCFNFSCGYVNEHSKNETQYFKELLETVDDVEKLILDKRAYENYEAEPSYGHTYGYNNYRTPVTTPKSTTTAQDFECMEVDDTWYFPEDLEALLLLYTYFTGAEYSESEPFVAPVMEEGDKAIFRKGLVAGGTYAGEKLTEELAKSLAEHTWKVTKVNSKLRLNLESEDGTSKCISIPTYWVIPVTAEKEK